MGGAAEVDGVPLLHGVDALHRGQEHVLVPGLLPVDLLVVDVDGGAGPLLQQAGNPQHVVKVAVVMRIMVSFRPALRISRSMSSGWSPGSMTAQVLASVSSSR